MTLKKALVSLLFLSVLLVLFSGSASAQVEYRITETELTRLEQIFSQLERNNQQILTDLELSQQDLTTARQKLASYQQELVTLQNQLLALKAESAKARIELEQANNLLNRAGASLVKYEAEVRSEIKSLTWQRNGLLLLVGILALK